MGKKKLSIKKTALASAVIIAGGMAVFGEQALAAGGLQLFGNAQGVEDQQMDVLNYIAAAELTLNKDTVTLKKGEKETLKLTVNPDGMNDVICWTSDNYDVAEVDQNGTITAKELGTTTIHAIVLRNFTVSGNDPFANAMEVTCKVNIVQNVSDILLDKSSKIIHVGDTYPLQATIIPVNASNKTLNWTSSEQSIATVDETGKVTAVAPGNVMITVTAADGTGITKNCSVKVTELVTKVFGDIVESDWWVNAVQFVYDYDIMAGTKAGFEPKSPITREQFVQVLYNHCGKPDATGIVNRFSDVKEDWYTKAVLWGNQNDIANGYDNGLFGIGDNITREQLTVMLYKYAKLKQYDLTFTSNLTDQFPDGNKVDIWAKEAMSWAVSQGIMSGKGISSDRANLRLDPLGDATRAECASMFMKLLTLNGVVE